LKFYGVRMNQLLERLKGDEKHDWSANSTYDVLWVLYDRVLRDDDRFLLSKGHGPMAYYAVLAEKGLIPEEELDRFGAFESILGYHPDRMLVPAAGMSSGSLGHGLPMAVGVALAAGSVGGEAAGARPKTAPTASALAGRRTFVLVGDGELDEGSNWEAIQFAGRARIASLTAIVIDNHSATHGWPGGIARRFDTEGWDAVTIDGRDHDAIETALRRESLLPRAVVAEVTR
jgi:transketolase